VEFDGKPAREEKKRGVMSMVSLKKERGREGRGIRKRGVGEIGRV